MTVTFFEGRNLPFPLIFNSYGWKNCSSAHLSIALLVCVLGKPISIGNFLISLVIGFNVVNHFISTFFLSIKHKQMYFLYSECIWIQKKIYSYRYSSRTSIIKCLVLNRISFTLYLNFRYIPFNSYVCTVENKFLQGGKFMFETFAENTWSYNI